MTIYSVFLIVLAGMNSALHAAQPANSLVDALTNYSGALTQLTAALQGKKEEEKKAEHKEEKQAQAEPLVEKTLPSVQPSDIAQLGTGYKGSSETLASSMQHMLPKQKEIQELEAQNNVHDLIEYVLSYKDNDIVILRI